MTGPKARAAVTDLMSKPPNQSRQPSPPLPPWNECELFCIHDYAGAGAAPCGWRGRLADARQDGSETHWLCPRCGCPTLIQLSCARD